MPPKEINKTQRAYDNNATLAVIIDTCTKAEVTAFVNSKGMDRPFKEVVAALQGGPVVVGGEGGEDEVTDIKLVWADSELQQVAETVASLVTFTPTVKVAINRLTGPFSRNNIPTIVSQFVENRGHREYGAFLDFTKDGTVPNRKKYRSGDYAFLVSVFTLWAVWATPSFRDTATSGGVVNTKLLLEMAERMSNVLNGDAVSTVSKKSYSGDLALAMRTWRNAQQSQKRSMESRPQFGQPSTSHGLRTETPGRGGFGGGGGSASRGGAQVRAATRTEGCFHCGDLTHQKKQCLKFAQEQKAKGLGG